MDLPETPPFWNQKAMQPVWAINLPLEPRVQIFHIFTNWVGQSISMQSMIYQIMFDWAKCVN